MARILVADEHALYRTGLRTILQVALPDAELLEAEDFDGLMRNLMEEQPIHLVLVSLGLTGSTDPQVIWDFKRASATTRYVVISSNGTFDQVLHYIAEGFHGFISKLQRDDEIIEAVQEVLAGRLAVPRGLTPFGLRGRGLPSPRGAAAPARLAAGSLRTDAPATRCPDAARRRALEPGDRPGASHRGTDGEDPRLRADANAQRAQSHRGGRARQGSHAHPQKPTRPAEAARALSGHAPVSSSTAT
jgi:DNA-binding NarL/FixJ family response regulator